MHVITVPLFKTGLTEEMVELQKFKTLGRCIAKIETWEVKLKNALNFGEQSVIFPNFVAHIPIY